MNEIEDKSREIYNQIYDIQSLSRCLHNAICYDFENCNSDKAYLLALMEIIEDKFKNLISDYDKFDLSLLDTENSSDFNTTE